MAPLAHFDSDSDYDITQEEEELLSSLVVDVPTAPLPRHLTVAARTLPPEATITQPPPRLQTDAVDSRNAASTPRRSARLSSKTESSTDDLVKIKVASDTLALSNTGPEGPSNDNQVVCYPDLSKALPPIERPSERPPELPKEERPPRSWSSLLEDDRSPLQRFRSFPKKPFSVSDLTAGSWCELQYYYVLTKSPFGRKTRTRVMKEGTRMHKDLEDEVHTTVRVEITSKEDAFGLRLWNLIQGLCTLRDTGLTRELEVWGFVDDNLVNGIIDGLSYDHPDPEFEEELSQSQDVSRSITDFFPSTNPGSAKIPQIYLTDVKTRSKPTAANAASLRPAKVQLYLYHRFLSAMIMGEFNWQRVFRRYNLDRDEPFSDGFLAQMAGLHDEEFFGADDEDAKTYVPPSSNDSSQSAPDLLKYGTLRDIVPLLESELKQSFPHGSSSVGRLLSVEYRYQADGSLIDTRIFPMDDHALDTYLGNTMEWWKKEREPRGVDIEDAWKCMVCEFAENCSWRKSIDDAKLQSVRQRLQAKRKNSNNA